MYIGTVYKENFKLTSNQTIPKLNIITHINLTQCPIN